MAYRDNLARKEYATARTKPYEVPAKHEKLREIKKPRKKYNISAIVFFNALLLSSIFICGFLVVTLYSNLTVLSKQEEALNTQLAELKSAEISLDARVSTMFNLGFVEEYAVNELEMIKIDETQIEYVNIQNNDKIEIKNEIQKPIISTISQVYYQMQEYMKQSENIIK